MKIVSVIVKIPGVVRGRFKTLEECKRDAPDRVVCAHMEESIALHVGEIVMVDTLSVIPLQEMSCSVCGKSSGEDIGLMLLNRREYVRPYQIDLEEG